MDSILIKKIRVIDPSQSIDNELDILIDNGCIKDLKKDINDTADQIIDGRGLIAAPGLVDMHVHLRDPGFTYKEDIYSGCKSAVAGGVTSLLAMPNTKPTTDSPEIVEYIIDKAKSANANVYVCASISKNLEGETICDLDALAKAGAIAISDDGRPVLSTAVMAEAMQKADKLGLFVTAHCEDLYLAKGGIINEGKISEKLGVKGIPNSAEDCGTAREIALSACYNVPIHICHVSTAGSVALIRDAKKRGVKVTAETCPHYFMLTENELLKEDADYRMNPPLRTETDRLAIIEGLKDGTIDTIVTDHAPHTPKEKADFKTAPNGSIGMETSLVASITSLVVGGHLTLNELINKMSTKPASLLKINAGTLSIGANADIVIFSIGDKYVVDPDKLHGKSTNTPFKHMKMSAKVHKTICNGRIVYNGD